MDSRTAALRRLRRELSRTYHDVMKRCEAEQRPPTEAELTLMMASDLRLKLYAESLREDEAEAA
jgi:hypothetical protein